MRDIYHETIYRAFLALSHSENMLEILRIWHETLGDNECDKQKSRIVTALITCNNGTARNRPIARQI